MTDSVPYRYKTREIECGILCDTRAWLKLINYRQLRYRHYISNSICWFSGPSVKIWHRRRNNIYQIILAIDFHTQIVNKSEIFESHTIDMLWEKFQWILPLYMKPISFQSKASVVCSVTAAVFIDFCLKKLNVFSQHICQKTNEYLNSTEQIPRNWNVDQLSMLIT